MNSAPRPAPARPASGEAAGGERVRVALITGQGPVEVSAHVAHLVVTSTKSTEFVDVTDACRDVVLGAAIDVGSAHVFCCHTTAGLVLNENEEGFHEDLVRTFDDVAPERQYWAHDDLTRRWQNLTDGERPNGHSHVRASLATHPSVVIPVVGGDLALGRWQRLLLLELDGPRSRDVVVQVWGGTAHHGGLQPCF